MDFKICVVVCIRYSFVKLFESQLYKLLFILNVKCTLVQKAPYGTLSLLQYFEDFKKLVYSQDKLSYKDQKTASKLLDLLNYEHLSGSQTLGS